MKITLILAAACVAACCTNCSKTSDPPSVSASKAAAPTASGGIGEDSTGLPLLMQAVFRKLRKDGDAAAMLPDPDDRTGKAPYLVHGEGSKLLPTGEAVLVASAVPTDDKGNPDVAHVTPGLLNIYFLKKQDGKWVVSARFDNIAELGSSGSIGRIEWIAPGKGKTGLAVEHGGTWSGYTITDLSLFDLSGGKARALTGEFIPIHSDNDGGCGPGGDCWNTDGKWTFAAVDGAEYDDLVLDFDDDKWTNNVEDEGSSAKVETPHKQTKGRARYRFDGKSYKLVQGANIVPPV